MFASAFALVLMAGSAVAAREPEDAAAGGFRVLTGRAATTFTLPTDVRLVRTWRDARRDLTYSRYQQFARPSGALVEGGQLTVARRGDRTALVIGAHYPSAGQGARNRLVVNGLGAIDRALADRDLLGGIPESVRGDLISRTELRLDPLTGRLFHHVESGASGIHVIHEIDAETGAIVAAWDAIGHANPGGGTGVRGDRKSLLGEDELGAADDLTTRVSGVWRMQSADGRVATYDAERDNHYYSGLSVMSDNAKPSWANDNDWTAIYQRAAVDAHYYANLTDEWFLDPANVGGFDAIADCADEEYGPLRIVAHFDETPGDGFGYDNAFFDGFSGDLVFGDGDGVTTGGFSGSQDVVSHEVAHRVTECRAPLKYIAQSGALNEAFSDIMATAMEWDFNEPTSSNCRLLPGQAGCPDWWIGEDLLLEGTSTFGFRSLEDPAAADQPGHWADRYTGFFDNKGVHINSTIPTHAFYLMVNGGRNARCSVPTDPKADCDVVVPSIPLEDAAQILFAAWSLLPYEATFCEASDATVASTELLFPGSDVHRAATGLAWSAVGRGQADCHPGVAPVSFTQRSIALAPGGAGSLDVTVAAGATDLALTPSAPPGTSLANQTVEIHVPIDLADGRYPITVSVNDGSGTSYASAVLVVDGTAPLADVAGVRLATSGAISAAGVMPLLVTWSAFDASSGLAAAELQASPSGVDGSWVTVASGTDGGTSAVDVGGNSEWFRVNATDAVGNGATSAPSGPWSIGRFHEGAATYKGSWSSLPAGQNWGSVRYSSQYGATAKFTFVGTDVTWISTRGSQRGKAKVYLDGTLIIKVDLYSATTSVRRISFAASGLSAGPHTLKIMVAKGGKRVDIDGFVVLGQ